MTEPRGDGATAATSIDSSSQDDQILWRPRHETLRLRKLGAVDDGDATLQLDLVPKPWGPDPFELLRRKIEVTDQLLATGMMAHVSVNSRRRLDIVPGPKWTPPAWKIV